MSRYFFYYRIFELTVVDILNEFAGKINGTIARQARKEHVGLLVEKSCKCDFCWKWYHLAEGWLKLDFTELFFLPPNCWRRALNIWTNVHWWGWNMEEGLKIYFYLVQRDGLKKLESGNSEKYIKNKFYTYFCFFQTSIIDFSKWGIFK